MELARVLRELSKRPRLLALGALIAAVAADFQRLQFQRRQAEGKLAATLLRQHPGARGFAILGARQASRSPSNRWPHAPMSTRTSWSARRSSAPSASRLGCQGRKSTPPDRSTRTSHARCWSPRNSSATSQITGETTPYRLAFESQEELPTITINSQAPTTSQAIASRKRSRCGPAAVRRGRGLIGRCPGTLEDRDPSARSGDRRRRRRRDQQVAGGDGVLGGVPVVVRADPRRDQVPRELAR